MPFAAAIPLISTGIGVAGSVIEANQARQAQKGYINNANNLAASQAAASNQLTPYAEQMYGQAMRNLDPAASYYKSGLAGGPQLLAAAAPQTNAIGAEYGSIMKADRSLYPRTGGNMLDTAYRAADQQQGVINSLRAAAPGGLTGVANAQGSLAASAANAARGAADTSLMGNQQGSNLAQLSAQNQANTLSNFQLTPDQWGALSKWGNGKGSGGTSGGAYPSPGMGGAWTGG